jgi:hypothetical protein
MLHSPLPGGVHGCRLVRLPVLGNVLVQRVIGVGCTHEGLNRKQDGADLQCGGPFIFEDVQADAAQLVHVGVVDLGQKSDLGRRKEGMKER